jgi:hypothetical protein
MLAEGGEATLRNRVHVLSERHMHFIPEELNDAYTALRMRICDASKPLSWVQHIKICMPEAKLMPPANEADIRTAERSLGIDLPKALKEFLRESDGVDALYSHPVCPIGRIVEMNRDYRTADYLANRMPFDHLLFFGDTGNGDDFAFPIYRSGEIGSAVFMWEHETDCRQEYAGGLSDFLIHYAVQFYSLRSK